jgi:hypothetical protein
VGRYRLKFSDDEFWHATPLKFWTIYRALFGKEKQTEQVQEATEANLFL